MNYLRYLKIAIVFECILITVVSFCLTVRRQDGDFAEPGADLGQEARMTGAGIEQEALEVAEADGRDYIKWVEFHAPEEALTAAYELDVATYQEDVHLNWVDLLAYVAAKHGGQFPSGSVRELSETAQKLQGGDVTMEELTKEMQYFPYYQQAYTAILGGFVGEYKIQKQQEDGTLRWESCYGLKAFSPIARGFYYEDYDDFGASRSYGYARPHLGHDMMGQIGTPI